MPESQQALDHHAGAHQEHQRQRDLAHNQQAACADTDRPVAAPALLERPMKTAGIPTTREAMSFLEAGNRT